MASSVEMHRAAHDAFNERDWERMRSLMAETITYGDRPRGLELASFDGFLGWLQEWATGMSDARVTESDYLEAGEYSVCRFMGRGTNDGPMGPGRGHHRQAHGHAVLRDPACRTGGLSAARSSATS